MMVLPQTTGGTVVISVEPSTTQVKIGETFEIVVEVQAGEQEVDGASAYLEFDPTYLEVVSMTPAEHLDLTLDNSFDNGTGEINFAAGKLTNPFPSGDFNLVTITLKAKAETPETSLDFLFNPPKSTDATFGGVSVFDHAEDGNITIIRAEKFSCNKVTDISKTECKALIALYDSTDGDNWRLNWGWKMTNTPCNWHGVTCQTGTVEKLELPSNKLNGAISKKFFKLKKLESLVLSDNEIDASIFKNVKKLKNLKTLWLNNCKLSGKLPNSLMKLKKLSDLDLNDNCLKTKVSKKLKKWLDELNPGWDETQTNCLY
ncbi:hypothetical protein PN36_29595 [Candidatus Thiomargarita nelsonii]|uniref:Cohesin domain-containing protein n=1 Tax=Candidatus Thiomargarita nelsonii TaxID=1003181 RepID=A0A4E0QLP3_9GAMM|nr:hypothetical protein PN36_29595 [Candidatus Thiomargarita nelsonii]